MCFRVVMDFGLCPNIGLGPDFNIIFDGKKRRLRLRVDPKANGWNLEMWFKINIKY